MRLKTQDKALFQKFFDNQSVWMEKNSLLDSKNLSEFAGRFIEFTKNHYCEDNLACKMFVIDLQKELLECEKRRLIRIYDKYALPGNNFNELIKHITDNYVILKWIQEVNES